MLTTMRYSQMIPMMTIVMKSLNSFRCRSMRVKAITTMRKMKEVLKAHPRSRNKNQVVKKQLQHSKLSSRHKNKECRKNKCKLIRPDSKRNSSNCGKNSKKFKNQKWSINKGHSNRTKVMLKLQAMSHKAHQISHPILAKNRTRANPITKTWTSPQSQ